METESGAVLVAQLDYIHFSFGLILFLLGAVCVSISRSGPLPTPWWMLGGFAFTLGVAEWLDVLAVGAGHPGGLRLLDVLLRAASFVFLLEFARRTTRLLTGDTPGAWIYGPAVAVLAGVAVVVGPEGLEAAIRLVLAGPAAFWTAGLFFLAARRTRDLGGAAASRRARGFASAFFALFGLAAGLVLPPVPFLPAGWPGPETFLAWTGVPVTLVRALLVGGMSLSIWALAVSFDPRGRTLRKRRALFWVVASAIVALLAGGWLFTERLGRLHESDTVADAEAAADAAHDHVVASLDAANRLTRTLAALVERYGGGGSPGKAEELDVLVDAVAAGQQDVVVYVLDADGTAVASSNRASPSSLVGRNFRERPYFRSARGGEPGRFTGMGRVTGVPGYYASEPVRGPSGEIAAVAVVKQDLVPVVVDPGGSGHVQIVSPGGDVVLSTRPEGAARPPSIAGAGAGTSWTTLDGRRHVAVVRDLPGTDWSLVLLQPESARFTDRLLGIVITLLLCVVILGAFVAMERQLGEEVRIA
ncbi:MAG TPA: cache domain-containing protein, partial [Anaeromyxobacteraceae bacterium]|nr:cache domain-containing protein [Anaeromyxobacteraceae bacterium]